MGKNKREFLVVFCIMIAFGFGWLIGFGNEVFFNTKGVMNQIAPVSNINPIGIDLRQMLSYSRSLSHLKTPYINANIYPPLLSIIGVPLLLMPIQVTYVLISFLTIFSLFGGLIIVSKNIGQQVRAPLIFLFFCITTFFSYGFHFELERGQLNLITLFFAVLGIMFFRQNKKILALVFLSLAIQLKLNPLIFLIFFFNFKFKDFKNLLFLGVSALFNAGLLFILGGKVFIEFTQRISQQFSHPFLWIGNHSLLSYCTPGDVPVTFCSLQMYPYLLAAYAIMLGTAILLTWRKKLPLFNSYLFALSGCGTLLVPSVSHDYTLSVLAIFLLPFCKDMYGFFLANKNNLLLFFLSLVVFLYTLTVFSYTTAWTVIPISVNKAPILILLCFSIFISMFFIPNTEKIKKLFV